jgi:phage shock protein C
MEVNMSQGRLVRSDTDKVIAGVCGGLAEYIGVDPVWVRVAFVLLIFASGIGIPLYLAMWIITPRPDALSLSGRAIVEKNINEMGQTVSNSLNNGAGASSAPLGVLLIIAGAFFLTQQLGWLDWWQAGLIWPLILVGAGIYLVARRSRQ